MNNLRGLLGIRKMDRVPNVQIRELCVVRKGQDERIDEGIQRWFYHVQRMILPDVSISSNLFFHHFEEDIYFVADQYGTHPLAVQFKDMHDLVRQCWTPDVINELSILTIPRLISPSEAYTTPVSRRRKWPDDYYNVALTKYISITPQPIFTQGTSPPDSPTVATPHSTQRSRPIPTGPIKRKGRRYGEKIKRQSSSTLMGFEPRLLDMGRLIPHDQ